jgi:hypothetical protein
VPLAIELAAGQLRRFDIGELQRRLGDQLALLAAPGSGDPERHATMEMTIDWSYQLLDRDEQRLLRHLGVFPSSFDVRAVEASAPPLTGSEPLALLGQLVDKSLIVRLPGSGRYRLLETIRAFARARLVEEGEDTAAFERHRLCVGQRIGSTSRLDRWMSARLGAELRGDLDDARQAFGLSVQQGHGADALEVALGSAFLWRNAIGCVEGDMWVDALLGLELSPRDRLWVQILRSDVGQGRGDPRQMFAVASSAEGVLGHTDDDAGACLVAHYRALASLTDPDEAAARLSAAVDLARRSGDARLVTLMGAFAAVADLAAGRNDEARVALDRLERAASEDGYDCFIVHWAGWMLALAERDAAAAWTWMARQQDYLDRTGIIETWITAFSTAMCDAIDGSDVRARLARTLELAAQEGYRAEPDCVLILAYAEMCGGRFEAAAELIGTAVHGRFNATAHYVLYRAVLDRMLRQELDDAAVIAGMDRGRARTAGDALAAHGVVPLVEAGQRR